MHTTVQPAPERAVSHWFNTPEPLALSGVRGHPALIHGIGQKDDMALGARIAQALAT